MYYNFEYTFFSDSSLQVFFTKILELQILQTMFWSFISAAIFNITVDYVIKIKCEMESLGPSFKFSKISKKNKIDEIWLVYRISDSRA